MSTPSPEPSGLPLRALAMVLLSAAIVFAGLGFISMSGSDAAASGSSSSATTSPTAAPQDGSGGASRAADASRHTQSAATGTTADSTGSAESGTAESGSAAATTTQAAATAAAGNVSDAEAKRTPVRVYNNSTVEGLAGDTAGTLESEGWSVAHVGNYNDGEVPRSAVYYGDGAGEKAAAQKVGAELGLPVEPRFAGIVSASPGVIVIVTADR
ncbi:LytR C-terminal domain-containing protein [Tomitella cavernea]|uniref:LytR C-terminal domain-containing protein n=1 Tax=Tomitella cavernea TaxID=1387982 RepID=UPI00190888DF|nr:LytR C-terminal domain-containing protein [Tomitella cavernea]